MQHESTHYPGIQNDEKSLIIALFKQIRNNSEKRFKYGRFLEPTVISLIGLNGEEDKTREPQLKSATFISIPYLNLQTLQPHSLKDSSAHPVRSLLQCHYGLESTERRDRSQVACKAYPKAQELQAVHVPQLWCLLLNKGLARSLIRTDCIVYTKT
jgi:hypothetical protein